jgi:hypothetical protein
MPCTETTWIGPDQQQHTEEIEMGWFDGGNVDPKEYEQALVDAAGRSGQTVSSSERAAARREAEQHNRRNAARNN